MTLFRPKTIKEMQYIGDNNQRKNKHNKTKIQIPKTYKTKKYVKFQIIEKNIQKTFNIKLRKSMILPKLDIDDDEQQQIDAILKQHHLHAPMFTDIENKRINELNMLLSNFKNSTSNVSN